MKIVKKYSILLGLVFMMIFTLTGCNTIAGVGQDLSAGGKAISKGANSVKNKM